MKRIGLSACEPSADLLAGALVASMRQCSADIEVYGLGGSAFAAAGGNCIASSGDTAVMGLVEVVRHLPRLLALRDRLARRFLQDRPEVFVGIDAPDFNIGLARRLRRAGIRTVQYVGPSVWAWRRYRLRGIAGACDLVLVLFPFEKAFYDSAGIPCRFVGHPAADRIPMVPDRPGARVRLGIGAAAPIVALLPGSRTAELSAHMAPFLAAARLLAERYPGARFVCAAVHDAARRRLLDAGAATGLALDVHVGRTEDVLTAADVAIVASGTATLEAMLCKTPMVVAYRMNPISYHVIRRLVHVKYAALPNLLAGMELVPEFLQDRCTPELLAEAASRWLEDPVAAQRLGATFSQLHAGLRGDGARNAATAILELAGVR